MRDNLKHLLVKADTPMPNLRRMQVFSIYTCHQVPPSIQGMPITYALTDKEQPLSGLKCLQVLSVLFAISKLFTIIHMKGIFLFCPFF